MAAVLGFQRALGVAADGIVGPVTWRALVSGMLSL
jgi:peptidoglycan hydrolase-like protein with peptidoglycan-binding domain